MDFRALIPIAMFVSAAFAIVGVAMARAIGRHADAKRLDSSPEILARLDRMEQAIDAIAVEVERVSEGQRFTTHLLSEKAGAQDRT